MATPALKYSSSKPRVGESGRTIGSGNRKDAILWSGSVSSSSAYLLPGGRENETFLTRLGTPGRLGEARADLVLNSSNEQTDVVGEDGMLVVAESAVHVRELIDDAGECKLEDLEELTEQDLVRVATASSAAWMSAEARS